jgi:hypothetical protein
MQHVPPPNGSIHWVYDDPSGVSDQPERRQPPRAQRRPIRVVRFVHREA